MGSGFYSGLPPGNESRPHLRYGWIEGDWDGDQDFTAADFDFVLMLNVYE